MELHFIEQIFENITKPPRVKGSNDHYANIARRYEYASKSQRITTFDEMTIDLMILTKKATGLKRRPFLIYNHSHGSDKGEALQLLESCDKLGLNIVIYDSRGCGKSSDTFVTFGHSEKIDLMYVLFYAVGTEQPNEFIMWGRSIGCCAVIQLVSMLTPSVKKSFKTEVISKINHSKSVSDKFKNSEILNSNFKAFLEKNKAVKSDLEFANFTIIGIILDSPIRSMVAAITNVIKSKILNVSFVASAISRYLNGYLEKKINIQLTEHSNEADIKDLLINTYLMFSKEDEFVSEEDEQCIRLNYSVNAEKRPVLAIKKLDVKHKGRRSSENIFEALKSIVEFKQIVSYSFCLENKTKPNRLHFTREVASSDNVLTDGINLNTPKRHIKGSLLQTRLYNTQESVRNSQRVGFFTANQLKRNNTFKDSPLKIEVRPSEFFANIQIEKKSQVEFKINESESDKLTNNPFELYSSKASNQLGSVAIRSEHVTPQGDFAISKYERSTSQIASPFRAMRRESSPISVFNRGRQNSQTPINIFKNSGSFIESSQVIHSGPIHGGYSVDKMAVNKRTIDYSFTENIYKGVTSNRIMQTPNHTGLSIFNPPTRSIYGIQASPMNMNGQINFYDSRDSKPVTHPQCMNGQPLQRAVLQHRDINYAMPTSINNARSQLQRARTLQIN